jgi:hypothetical protein
MNQVLSKPVNYEILQEIVKRLEYDTDLLDKSKGQPKRINTGALPVFGFKDFI